MKLFSPAKVNLFLRVVGKRKDGYHELSTLMQTVDFGDTLSFSPAERPKLTTTQHTLPTDSSNLILKALYLFQEKTGLLCNFHIHLEKRIPTQAGLGGGSSNAATTLYALNALHHFPVPLSTLTAWSLALGSDVPFFFSSGAAYCRGRGELVESRPSTTTPLYLLLSPDGLSTQAVFAALRPEECSSVDRLYHNDLESSARRLLPSLPTIEGAFMTGSGSTFVTTTPPHAPAILTHPITRSEEGWYSPHQSATLSPQVCKSDT